MGRRAIIYLDSHGRALLGAPYRYVTLLALGRYEIGLTWPTCRNPSAPTSADIPSKEEMLRGLDD